MARKGLILTGFMAAGKSTVGKRAARELGVGYHDTDEWMETESGIDVPQLVRTDMAAFRILEAATLSDILELEPGIVSTGGGIVSTEIGRNALTCATSPVVWLRLDFDTAADRATKDSGRERPLFDDIDKARALYEQRLGWYEDTADYVVDASRAEELVAGEVVDIFNGKN